MKELAPDFTRDSASSNEKPLRASAGVVVAATVASGALNYLYTFVLTRLLPTRGYSAFSSSLALLLVVGTVSNAAVPWILAKELRGNESELSVRRLVSAGFILNVLLGLAAAVICGLAASNFLSPLPLLTLAVGAFGFFVASTGMGWALGRGRYGLLAAMITGEVAVKVVIGILWVGNGGGILGAIGAATAGSLSVVALSVFVMKGDRRFVRPGPHFGRVMRSSAGLSLLQGAMVAAAVVDVILVEIVLSANPKVASYQLAATVGRAPIFLAMAVTAVVFPTIVGGAAQRERDGIRVFEGLSLLLKMVLPAWAILATIPRSIILLVAPASYVEALRFLPVTAASGLIWAVVVHLSCCLVAAGRLRPIAITVIVCGALSALVMVIIGRTFGVWAFAEIEVSTAVSALVGVVVLSARQWGAHHNAHVFKSLVWLIPVVPLVLVRDLPVIWMAGAVVTGTLALISSFPVMQPATWHR